MRFTDYHAENSCTAGRSSFITGQTPLRSGLSMFVLTFQALTQIAMPRVRPEP